jgi:hypothetical protein
VFSFQWNLWRPLYWTDNGTKVSAKDILFFIDLVKAGVKKSPANWADYAPGYFPDDVASTAEPNATTLVLKLKSAVNPSWLPHRRVELDHDVRDQPALANRGRALPAVGLRLRHRRVHHDAERDLRRPARDADVEIRGRRVHLGYGRVQRGQGRPRRRRLRPAVRRAAARRAQRL